MTRVIAIGCLVPILLVFVGAAAGGAIGGTGDAVWGAVAGGVVGLVVMVGLGWGWERIRGQRF